MEASTNIVGYGLAILVPLLILIGLGALVAGARSGRHGSSGNGAAATPRWQLVLGGVLLVLLLVQSVGFVMAYAI